MPPRRPSLTRHYVLDGKTPRECSLLEWAAMVETPEARTVARTAIGDDCEVSTVFLGLDHRFAGEGPPILFETMVFYRLPKARVVCGMTIDRDGTYQRRYCTWDEAVEGHAHAVAMVERGEIKRPEPEPDEESEPDSDRVVH